MPLPNCIILGAQKAGTTALKLALMSHPAVDAPAGECAFFEDPDYGDGGTGPLERLFESSVAPVRLIKRPAYLAKPECPPRIRQHCPDARLVAVLRHPVDRARSAYFHYVARGLLPMADPDRGMAAVLAGTYDADWPAAGAVVAFGDYDAHLARYRDLFPADQLHVLLYDDLTRDLSATAATVCRFLAIDDAVDLTAPRANTSTWSPARVRVHRLRTRLRREVRVDQARTEARPSLSRPRRWMVAGLTRFDQRVLAGRDRPPVMDPSLRQRWLAHYEPGVSALEQRLGRDLSAWRS